MRKKHKKAIQALVQMRVFLWLQKLETKVCLGKLSAPFTIPHAEGRSDIHVKTGDSRSCTNLSI